MEYRILGRTGLSVSALGFGCGAVGGLLVRGTYRDQVAAVARAIELGITYFDTAASYGEGASERNLGRVLAELGSKVIVGTKVQLSAPQLDDIAGAIVTSVEASLKRLQRECIDLIQLHNPVGPARRPARRWAGPDDVEQAIAAFGKLRQAGKVRFWGMNGLGESAALQQVIARADVDTVQCCYNLLNPSAGQPVPPGFPFQDYGRLIDTASTREMGVIAIRVLAAGALSGSAERHPNAAQDVAPIATSASFQEDVNRAGAFAFLVEDGFVTSPVEGAIRFALSKPGIATALVGLSNMDQLEQAAAAAEQGPLPPEALKQLKGVWAKMNHPL